MHIPDTFCQIQEKSERYLLDLYNRMPIAFVRGDGAKLYDTEGQQYLDFMCGIAVNSLGHADHELIAAIKEQADRLLYSTENSYGKEHILLAEALSSCSIAGKVFFCNSGTETIEIALQIARLYGKYGKPEKPDKSDKLDKFGKPGSSRKNEEKIKEGTFTTLSLQNSFHGRTSAAICLTGQEAVREGFGPLLGEHHFLPANKIDVLEREFASQGEKICALFVELIQGEGGVIPLEQDYVLRAQQLCRQYRALFIVDEIQTGIGRTGKMFAFQHYGLEPDLICCAKALGSGLPIGAVIVADRLTVKKRDSALCGDFTLEQFATEAFYPIGHLAARAALETLRIIEKRNLLDNVNRLAPYFKERLRGFERRFATVKQSRIIGFHIGMELDRPGAALVQLCLQNGLIINCTAGNVIRIMPPLILSHTEAKAGLDILERALEQFSVADLSS